MNFGNTSWLFRLTWAISAITMATGAFQIVLTGWELDFLDAENSPATRQMFATVGMFMVLFGGVVIHALRDPGSAGVALLWGSLQKFGASIAVGIGVVSGVFSALALGVALFDLFSGVIFLMYRNSRGA